jgi:hypothetical protein
LELISDEFEVNETAVIKDTRGWKKSIPDLRIYF